MPTVSRPLVSVMLPCFNAADTLPLALGALLAQTVTDWECVCIDDGSSDETWKVLSAARQTDSRFTIERFAENRGRGAARQRALELARGEFLAFQDSDDWMYPDRLDKEMRWMAADSRIVAVSACAAVTEGSETLVGVMRPRSDRPLPIVEPFEEPVPPPLLFPTSMVRTDLAKSVGFDPAFLRSQDSDFLIRMMLGRHYALGSEVLYAYSQGTAASLERSLEGYKFRMRSHMRHIREYPTRVARTLTETGAKYLTYRVAGLLQMDRRLIERRWGDANDEIARDFQAALATVKAASLQLSAA